MPALQDGPDFYKLEGGLIASYPELVANDFDMEGAIAARARFLIEHREYRMATDREAFN